MTDEKHDKPAVARTESADRRLQMDLDRMITDKLMANADTGDALTRDLDSAAAVSLPTFGEIESIVSKGISEASSTQPGAIFDLDTLGDVTVKGVRLNELLDRGGASIEERAVLKRGLLFLRKRMYSEAVEWWMLNRPKDHIAHARFHCLLTLLLALTYEWSGDPSRAQATKEEAIQTMKLVK